MKAFVIFPTFCVFVLTLTLIMLVGKSKFRDAILWTIVVTSIFGGLATWFSIDVFTILYFFNFIGILVCIPCLTYLANRLFPDSSSNKMNWLRILGLGFASTIVTIIISGTLIFFSFLNNPMDPVTNKKQKINKVD